MCVVCCLLHCFVCCSLFGVRCALSAGCWPRLLSVGCCLVVVVCVFGCSLLSVNCRSLSVVFRCALSVVGCGSVVCVGCCLVFVVCGSLFAARRPLCVGCRLSVSLRVARRALFGVRCSCVVCCLLFCVCCSLCDDCCMLLIAWCSLFILRCLSFAGCWLSRVVC